MDLSKLPLMPSAELPVAVPAPEATPIPPARPYNWQPEERAAEGCACPSCERLRMDLRDFTGRATPTVNPIVWFGDTFDPTATSSFDPAAAFAASTSTGHIGASSPQVANLPRSTPPVQESRRIRGRYSHPTSGLSGAVRWREPGTLSVWDAAISGLQQWTFGREGAGGVLQGGRGGLMEWYPTEV